MTSKQKSIPQFYFPDHSFVKDSKCQSLQAEKIDLLMVQYLHHHANYNSISHHLWIIDADFTRVPRA